MTVRPKVSRPSIRSAVILIWLAGCSTTSPPPILPSTDENALSDRGSLFESADESKLRRETNAASALARSLSQFAGVERARVHLSLADNSALLKSPQSKSTAAVLIVHAPKGRPEEKIVREFVVKAVPNLTPENLSVVFTPSEKAAEPIVELGYLRVAAGSVLFLKLTLAILLIPALLTGLGLIFAGISIRKLKRTPRRDDAYEALHRE